jgi:hypothetical protein
VRPSETQPLCHNSNKRLWRQQPPDVGVCLSQHGVGAMAGTLQGRQAVLLHCAPGLHACCVRSNRPWSLSSHVCRVVATVLHAVMRCAKALRLHTIFWMALLVRTTCPTSYTAVTPAVVASKSGVAVRCNKLIHAGIEMGDSPVGGVWRAGVCGF